MVDFAMHTGRILARLGQTVSITPTGEPQRQVQAVFAAPPAVAFGLVDGSAPTLRLTTADAVGLVHGDPISVGGVSYTVARRRDDTPAGDVLIDLEAV